MMFNSLRGRFIFSHILPLLITIPLMGVATIYLLEQQVLIPSMLSELRGNALILSRMAASETAIWNDPNYAARLLTQSSFYENGRLMLLDDNQVLMASSSPADASRIGTQINLPGVEIARQGKVASQLVYSDILQDDIADALAPVFGPDGEILGYVRLSYHRYSLAEQIYRMRYLIIGILAIGLVLGSALGITLALHVSAPVEDVTQAVYRIVNGEQNETLVETGSEETRRLARSVNVLVDRLRNLETARKRLLANLVHEIGRPLGALRMAIEALSNGANHNPEFYAELLAGMDQETARLQHLLTDLSHLYEQSLGELELERQKIDLVTWLPAMLSPWQQAALEKKLHWSMYLPETLPTIYADPLRLGQVVGNLASNAIKFTPAGGSVKIEAGATEKEAWIRVKDSGPGIPLEEKARLFTPFMRGKQGRRFPQGMGLGLSIARELVEAHGGRLELESEPGWGAAFTIWLPFNPDNKL